MTGGCSAGTFSAADYNTNDATATANNKDFAGPPTSASRLRVIRLGDREQDDIIIIIK